MHAQTPLEAWSLLLSTPVCHSYTSSKSGVIKHTCTKVAEDSSNLSISAQSTVSQPLTPARARGRVCNSLL